MSSPRHRHRSGGLRHSLARLRPKHAIVLLVPFAVATSTLAPTALAPDQYIGGDVQAGYDPRTGRTIDPTSPASTDRVDSTLDVRDGRRLDRRRDAPAPSDRPTVGTPDRSKRPAPQPRSPGDPATESSTDPSTGEPDSPEPTTAPDPDETTTSPAPDPTIRRRTPDPTPSDSPEPDPTTTEPSPSPTTPPPDDDEGKCWPLPLPWLC